MTLTTLVVHRGDPRLRYTIRPLRRARAYLGGGANGTLVTQKTHVLLIRKIPRQRENWHQAPANSSTVAMSPLHKLQSKTLVALSRL